MSETVHYKGTLRKEERHEGETLEEHCKRLMNNQELPTYFDSYLEFMEDTYYKELVVIDDDVYRVEKENVDADSDIYTASKNEDGSIAFEVRYYNGSCSFAESIEEATKNLNK